jgi:hypothetical protein
MMDDMRKHMTTFHGCIKVVIKVMYVHIAIAETTARCHMEIANDLIDSKASFYSASLSSLRIQSLSIVFALALLDVLTSSKCPGDRSIGLADFVASVAAPWLLRVRRRICTIAFATIVWSKMCSLVFHRVPTRT